MLRHCSFYEAMVRLISYRELIKNLVLKDLRVKYRDSVLGFLWSLANPLLLILVYSFVFSHMLRVEIPNFSLFIVVGILPWNFFAQSMMMATGSIVENGSLIRKVPVPMEVFPVATVLFNVVQFALVLAVFFPMVLLFFRAPLSLSILMLFPVLFLHVVFTLGVTFLISTATVFYRDVRHFTEILLMLLFWLTPIVYDVRIFPESLRSIIYWNPATSFILSYQDVFYHGVIPSLSRFLIMVLLAVSFFASGYSLFGACKVRFPEEV